MAKHFIISPSSLERILACPGSLYGPAEPDVPSAAAEEGTTCHALLEFCLTFNASPRDMLGSTDFNPKFPITIEMVEAVELFAETVKGLLKEFNIPPSKIQSETMMVHSYFPELFGGTADCLVPGDDALIIVDLKFGRKPVYGDSPQLTAYSLLAMDHVFRQTGKQYDKVIQVIVQPRCNPSVSRHQVGSDELTKVWNGIADTVNFLRANPDMTDPMYDSRRAGDHCKFCRRREGCPARMQMLGEIAEAGVLLAPQPDGELKMIANGTTGVPTEQLVDWLKKFDVLKEFMTEVTNTLKRRAASGEPVPGLKLVLSYGHRAWVDEEEKIKRKLPRAIKGLTAKDVVEQSVRSPAQIEKVMKAKKIWSEHKDAFQKLCASSVKGVKLVDVRAGGEEVRPETAIEYLNALKESEDNE